MAAVPGIAELQAALGRIGIAPPRIPEAALSSLPLHTSWRFADIPPTAPLYMYREARLTWSVWNANPGATFVLAGLFIGMDGIPHELNWVVTPTSDRALNRYDFVLTEGFLLHFSVQMSGGSAVRGSAYTTVALTRGIGPTSLPLALLLADNLTTSGWLGWPGGMIRASLEGPGAMRSLTTPNPGTGNDWTVSVPTNARWRLWAVYQTLTTGAPAGRRTVRLIIDDGTTTLLVIPPNQLAPPSSVINYAAMIAQPPNITTPTVYYHALPQDLFLLPGWRLRSSTPDLNVNDVFSAISYGVEEWIQV